MATMTSRLMMLMIAVVSFAYPALGQFNSGSDGSDGEFSPDSIVIDLATAPNGNWLTTPGGDVTGDGVADGVYDAEQWAVVFKYTTITIPQLVTVKFKNHPSGAPVVWLAQGDVLIQGTVNLNGANGASNTQLPSYAIPGPGGFHGGRGHGGEGLESTYGLGPGGCRPLAQSGAGYATAGIGSNGGPSYGSKGILPLIGGSGGSGIGLCLNSAGGGAGGGAILIASSGAFEITSSGAILANGGTGGVGGANGGSGGAIRLAAVDIDGSGQLSAIGGTGSCCGCCCGNSGSVGRNRLESDHEPSFPQANSSPDYTFEPPSGVFPDYDADDGAPSLKATVIRGFILNADPEAGINTPDVLVDDAAVTIHVEATNIPVGTTVQIRMVTASGGGCQFADGANNPDPCLTCELKGSDESSSCSRSVVLEPGRSEIQLKANW